MLMRWRLTPVPGRCMLHVREGCAKFGKKKCRYSSGWKMFDRYYERFERAVSLVLLVLMGVIVLAATAELIYLLYQDLLSPPGLFLGVSELFQVFGLFMMVLIAIELMSSIYMYLKDKVVHVEIIFLIGITAVTRKIVILDSKDIDPFYLMGLASLLAALTGGYYLIKKRTQEK